MNPWGIATGICVLGVWVGQTMRYRMPEGSYRRGFALGIELGYMAALPFAAWMWSKT